MITTITNGNERLLARAGRLLFLLPIFFFFLSICPAVAYVRAYLRVFAPPIRHRVGNALFSRYPVVVSRPAAGRRYQYDVYRSQTIGKTSRYYYYYCRYCLYDRVYTCERIVSNVTTSAATAWARKSRPVPRTRPRPFLGFPFLRSRFIRAAKTRSFRLTNDKTHE